MLALLFGLVKGLDEYAVLDHVGLAHVLGGSENRQRALARFGALMVFVLFALIAVLSVRVVWDDFRFGETSPGIGVPQWWYTIWLPVLSVAIAGRALGLFIRRGRQP